MGQKGIWIAILLILAGGAAATRYTKHYVAATEAAAADVPALARAAVGTEAPDLGTAGAGDDGKTETAKETEVMVRLHDLDLQIARANSGEQDATTSSMRAAAESERRLWEGELNRILNLLGTALPEEKRTVLFTEQKSWARSREADAAAASQKQSSSSMEELEYNRSMKNTTRERAYQLAEEYEAYFEPAEN